MKTAVEFLAERYNYITWMRNRDEISAGTADEWREKFFKEAKEMEKQQLKCFLEWYNDDPFGEIGAMSYNKAVKEYLKTL